MRLKLATFIRTTAALLALAEAVSSCQKAAKAPANLGSSKAPVVKKREVSAGSGHSRGEQLQPVHWKAVVMTGDDSIGAFDHARSALRTAWLAAGIRSGDIRELSMSPEAQHGSVAPSSAKALAKALSSLKPGPGDGCLVHLTSHGAPWGFYLRGQPSLTPSALDQMLTAQCGDLPTVVVVSACYSGVFAGNAMRKPNRAIFTAARDDRTSFGCGVENDYTFFDKCMLDELPLAATWPGLGTHLQSCIRAKERTAELRYSYPQAVVGAALSKASVPKAGALSTKGAHQIPKTTKSGGQS